MKKFIYHFVIPLFILPVYMLSYIFLKERYSGPMPFQGFADMIIGSIVIFIFIIVISFLVYRRYNLRFYHWLSGIPLPIFISLIYRKGEALEYMIACLIIHVGIFFIVDIVKLIVKHLKIIDKKIKRERNIPEEFDE